MENDHNRLTETMGQEQIYSNHIVNKRGKKQTDLCPKVGGLLCLLVLI